MGASEGLGACLVQHLLKVAALALVRPTTVLWRTAKRLFPADKEEDATAYPLSERGGGDGPRGRSKLALG